MRDKPVEAEKTQSQGERQRKREGGKERQKERQNQEFHQELCQKTQNERGEGNCFQGRDKCKAWE